MRPAALSTMSAPNGVPLLLSTCRPPPPPAMSRGRPWWRRRGRHGDGAATDAAVSAAAHRTARLSRSTSTPQRLRTRCCSSATTSTTPARAHDPRALALCPRRQVGARPCRKLLETLGRLRAHPLLARRGAAGLAVLPDRARERDPRATRRAGMPSHHQARRRLHQLDGRVPALPARAGHRARGLLGVLRGWWRRPPCARVGRGRDGDGRRGRRPRVHPHRALPPALHRLVAGRRAAGDGRRVDLARGDPLRRQGAAGGGAAADALRAVHDPRGRAGAARLPRRRVRQLLRDRPPRRPRARHARRRRRAHAGVEGGQRTGRRCTCDDDHARPRRPRTPTSNEHDAQVAASEEPRGKSQQRRKRAAATAAAAAAARRRPAAAAAATRRRRPRAALLLGSRHGAKPALGGGAASDEPTSLRDQKRNQMGAGCLVGLAAMLVGDRGASVAWHEHDDALGAEESLVAVVSRRHDLAGVLQLLPAVESMMHRTARARILRTFGAALLGSQAMTAQAQRRLVSIADKCKLLRRAPGQVIAHQGGEVTRCTWSSPAPIRATTRTSASRRGGAAAAAEGMAERRLIFAPAAPNGKGGGGGAAGAPRRRRRRRRTGWSRSGWSHRANRLARAR